VGLDRRLADEERVRDLGIALAAGEHAQDLGLALGQLVQLGRAGRDCGPLRELLDQAAGD
jgi:hypothetical protein